MTSARVINLEVTESEARRTDGNENVLNQKCLEADCYKWNEEGEEEMANIWN